MATATPPPTTRTPTLGDVLAGLDPSLPVDRVLLGPRPGTATAADVEAINLREDRLCELIDGTLVEKTVGQRESRLALLLGQYFLAFVLPRGVGIVLGADGMTRLKPDQVRIPDVAVYLNARFPGGKIPEEAIPAVVPDLAVEVLSDSNIRAEMSRKLREYSSSAAGDALRGGRSLHHAGTWRHARRRGGPAGLHAPSCGLAALSVVHLETALPVGRLCL